MHPVTRLATRWVRTPRVGAPGAATGGALTELDLTLALPVARQAPSSRASRETGCVFAHTNVDEAIDLSGRGASGERLIRMLARGHQSAFHRAAFRSPYGGAKTAADPSCAGECPCAPHLFRTKDSRRSRQRTRRDPPC